ncbi:MAG TPA: hypothetical protein V6D08_03160 [Candidatus Obscuribacterales bacterium]
MPRIDSSVEDPYDLSFLHNFSCDCPDARIADALKHLVAAWLSSVHEIPHFLGAVEEELHLTGAEAVHIRWLLALNPNTPPAILDELHGEGVAKVLERIAENPRTSAETLKELAYQAVVDIRIAVAGNINTPVASIMMLSADDSVDVRLSLAENHNIPFAALEVLANDDNPYVKFRAEKTLKRLRY